jgi:uncharacterized protein (DUF427 family)
MTAKPMKVPGPDHPYAAVALIKDHVAFHPDRVDGID